MKNVLLFNPYCLWDFHLNYEVPIYHNLKSRGFNPIYIRCGIASNDCDLFWRATYGGRPQNACELCSQQTDILLKQSLIDYKSLSDFISVSEMQNISKMLQPLSFEELKSVVINSHNVFNISISSVHTHFRVNQLDPTNLEHLTALRNYMQLTAFSLIAASNILHEFKPVSALIFNGRMASTRAFLEVCSRHNVHYSTHERGLNRGALSIVYGDYCLSNKPHELIAKNNLNRPLKEHQVNLIKEWCKLRRTGNNTNWKAFITEEHAEKTTFNISNKTKWSIFTSSTDEIVCAKELFYSNFSNQFEWINRTVNLALKNPNEVELIIRVHPNSSSKFSTGHNIEEKEFFSKLKISTAGTNVTVIESDELQNSYAIVDNSDLVLCYVSSIAIESVISGKPTYVAANCEWIHCPSISNFKQHIDYENFLESRIEKENCKITDEEIAIAYRFLYNIIYNHNFSFPFIEQISPSKNRLTVSNTSDFSIGMFPELDRAVDCVLGISNTVRPNHGFIEENDLICEATAIKAPFENTYFASVIITNYNYGSYIEKCVESVINQDVADIEIIIVDDGSTDNSAEIIQSIIHKYPNHTVKAIFQKNSGQPAISRNNGINIAKGKFILPLDADDTIAPGYISGCREIAEKRPEVNVIYADSIHVYSDKEVRYKPGILSTGRLAKLNQIFIASFYTKTLWQEVGGYKTNVRGYEDWDMWLNMSLNGAIGAYYENVGLIYNAKQSGLYQQAKSNSEILYANLILNNRQAYNFDLDKVRWAETKISCNE